MEYKDIFEMTNKLIDILEFTMNENLQMYISNCVENNCYASEEGYKEFIKED